MDVTADRSGRKAAANRAQQPAPVGESFVADCCASGDSEFANDAEPAVCPAIKRFPAPSMLSDCARTPRNSVECKKAEPSALRIARNDSLEEERDSLLRMSSFS